MHAYTEGRIARRAVGVVLALGLVMLAPSYAPADTTKKETRTYLLATAVSGIGVGSPELGLGVVSFTPPRGAKAASFDVADTTASALGRKTSASACQDVNGNDVCEDNEPNVSFCNRTPKPMALNPEGTVSVFIDALGVCGSEPGLGTGGTVTASFLLKTGKTAVQRILKRVEGVVLTPIPSSDQDAPQAQQCAYLSSPNPEFVQGLFGWITPVTATKKVKVGARLASTPVKFSLIDTGAATGVDDWEIHFYKSLGTCGSGPIPVAKPHTNAIGNEQGSVPRDAKVAIITMFSGVPLSGFRYTEQ